MKIAVDKNAPIPAYKQVVDGIATAIDRGDVRSGSRLPSVRNLALELGLNVNTVARAYRDLERAGVIDTMPGMGTFVAEPGPRRETQPEPSWSRPAPTPAPSGDWRRLLATALELARSEGIEASQVAEELARIDRESGADAVVLTDAETEGADLLRALPSDWGGRVRLGAVGDLRSLDPQVVLTTFPSQLFVRRHLEEVGVSAQLLPVETELTEAVVASLTDLREDQRLALVTVEKACWDQEANDVMKIIGRGRWLKMVFLDHGERGLQERLEQVDRVLCVPRARTLLIDHGVAEDTLLELHRQLSERSRRQVEEALRDGRPR